jgi:uncharacterized protein (DUF4415 family)
MKKTKPTWGVPDEENPEWTKEDFARSLTFDQLPASLQAKLSAIQEASRKKRGLQKEPTKVLTSIRLSPDVLEGLRATGKGWQSRADEALRAFVKRQPRQVKPKQTVAKKATRKAA